MRSLPKRLDRRRLGGVALVAAFAAFVALFAPLPAAWTAPVESRRVLDREGVVLGERTVPNRGHERWVELGDVAPHVVDALVASEDRRFRRHLGVDPLAVGRAALANLRAGRVVQGGSTLTQQVARLLAGRPAGALGKGVEAWRAARLEARLTKDEILTWYLNRAYFGRRAWGIEAAARAWFGETASGLSVAEAAALVALLPAPERLGPDVAPEASKARRDRVLQAMVEVGYLTVEEADRAAAEPLQLRRARAEGLAPHLVARALDQSPDQDVVRTTLDAALQRDVEALVADAVAGLAGRDVDHAAVLVADVSTGEVLAYVGSADFGADDGQVDGVTALRSPGSALKPFLYGLAFEAGATPADVLPDLPRAWTTGHGAWSPENYSADYHGPVRAREALACSYNLPAVALLERVGVATLLQRLEVVGMSFPEPPAHYGLGLAIGGAEVTLEQLVGAYAGLARGGSWAPLSWRAGASPTDGVPFLRPEAAWLVTDVLADPVARIPAFGRRTPLARGYPAAVKTGTSSGFRDNWTVGYTPRHVVGVWVGNFDGRAMGDVSGVTGAGPLWARVLDRVTGDARTAFPPPPETLVLSKRCALSGLAPGPSCPSVVHEHVPRDAGSAPPCHWHRGDGGVDWPSEYRTWAADHDLLPPSDPVPAESGAPAASSPTVEVEGVAISWPRDGASLYVDPTLPADRQRVVLRPAAPARAREARWTVDGRPVSTPGPHPLEAWWTPLPGVHTIELEVDGVRARAVRVEVSGGTLAPAPDHGILP